MTENNHMQKDLFDDEELDDIHMDKGRKGKENWSRDWGDNDWNKPSKQENPSTKGHSKSLIRFQIN